MRLHDTVPRMRELLADRDVRLSRLGTEPEAVYEGEGRDATAAWEAFREVAAEPAFDPVSAWGETHPVENAGYLFEAMLSQGWPKNPHIATSRSMPEHYELMFTRQFAVGEYGDMMGLFLTIFVPAAEELRPLHASFFGDGDGTDPIVIAASAATWIERVEDSPAFAIPMARHRPERFSFCIDGIG